MVKYVEDGALFFRKIQEFMSNASGDSDTQSLSDRERFIEEELLPTIGKTSRYLGSVDFNSEFYARKEAGQANWEFEDRHTKATFRPIIIGEVAEAFHGTKLKGKGNYKASKFDPVCYRFFASCEG